MRSTDLRAIGAHPAERLHFLRELVGFTEDDRAAMTESLVVLGPRLPGILDALYDDLLAREDTRRIFLGGAAEIDPVYMMQRKEHLTEWVLAVAASPSFGDVAVYLEKVAAQHTGRESPQRAVPPRYVVGVTSRLQTAFTEAIFDAVRDDPRGALRMSVAWSKFLSIQLELFLFVLARRFPAWDEPLPANGTAALARGISS